MVIKPSSLDSSEIAQAVLEEAARDVNLRHAFNYLSPRSRPKTLEEYKSQDGKNSENRIIYTIPGKARSVEMILRDTDLRAGLYPQHNSQAYFTQHIEQLPAISFMDYSGLLGQSDLLAMGFVEETTTLTQKRLLKLSQQFSQMTLEAFKQMICVYDLKQRDYKVFVRRRQLEGELLSKLQSEIEVAVFNPHFGLLQFVQKLQRNLIGEVINLKHITFDAGEPVVINESRLDQFGKLRQIAHVGDWSGKSEYLNSVERFDDGTILWTITEQTTQATSASAALKDNGQIIILKDLDTPLHQAVARNLGAEGIDPQSGKWTGFYDADARKSDNEDKYLLRRSYKDSIRKQVYQIIDGAAIPGLLPIFDVS